MLLFVLLFCFPATQNEAAHYLFAGRDEFSVLNYKIIFLFIVQCCVLNADVEG